MAGGLLAFTQPKRVIAVLDYTVDWTPWLVLDDTISSVVFTIVPFSAPPASGDCAVAPASPPISGGLTSCWITEGVAGVAYKLTALIVTSGGRTDERDAILQVIA
jgi:hypothetical protein